MCDDMVLLGLFDKLKERSAFYWILSCQNLGPRKLQDWPLPYFGRFFMVYSWFWGSDPELGMTMNRQLSGQSFRKNGPNAIQPADSSMIVWPNRIIMIIGSHACDPWSKLWWKIFLWNIHLPLELFCLLLERSFFFSTFEKFEACTKVGCFLDSWGRRTFEKQRQPELQLFSVVTGELYLALRFTAMRSSDSHFEF